MVMSRTTIATPPGATIKEQLSYRKMSQKEFSTRMGMSEKHISRLINGEVHLTPDVAERLEMVLGLPAKFWNNLEAIYQEQLTKAKAENAFDEDSILAKNYPYNEMAKYNWVPQTKDIKEKVINLRKFFEVAELGFIKNDLIPCIAFRKLSATEKSDYAMIAWVQKARLCARTIKTKPINIPLLLKSIDKIRAMTKMDPSKFCPDLESLLADCGIAIVYLPHIGGTFLHGATFCEGRKIVLGLTVRGKDADKFWFSLFHELAHIIKGHINQTNGTTTEDESSADSYAKDILINNEHFIEFVSRNSFSSHSVLAFSEKEGIHAGIVVGRLQKEGYIPYNQLNVLKTKYVIA